MGSKLKTSGFTLVELMVVIAIMAILAAWAIPSYQAQVNKSRRADAKATLMGESQRLERCFTDTDTYSGCEPSNYNPGKPSYKGYYTISAVDGQNSTISATAYTLTAAATGPQVNDTACQSFTLNNLGIKTAKDADGNDTTAQCWN
jgi:type IV pilus assembly protein PilE